MRGAFGLAEELRKGANIEFKAKIDPIARDVCSFLNTEGGTVLCGVSDGRRILGVPAGRATQRVSEVLQK
ncbi:MAG: ATP-binding protein, partial [Candidatus Eisenbacteria sp.]|nr:ATP-binding protein [Candidatus Eisenbacteria bacterium]